MNFFNVELQEEQKNRAVEDGVANPSANPIAPAFPNVQRQHSHVAHQVASQQHHLAVHHERKTCARQSDSRPEPVAVHDRVEQRGGQYGQDLERLGEFQPEERHEDEDRLVEEVEERQSPAAEDGEECAEEVEKAGEVEDVGPEEDASGRAGAEREAEEPLERGGLSPPPEPAGVANLCGGGDEDAGEYDGGD